MGDEPKSLLDDHAFLSDFARFSEGILDEQFLRRKYHFVTDDAWVTLGADEQLIEAIMLEKVRRMHSGATKRELAQKHVIAAPDVLNSIMVDPAASAKHRIDSARTLDTLATPESRFAQNQEHFSIKIDLTADTRAKDGSINPADILVIDRPIRPTPSNDTDIIDATPAQVRAIPNNSVDEPPPVRRGRGRPPGSKNKPKTTVPVITAKRTDEGGSGEPL